MTDSRLLKYQSLLEGAVTKLKVCGNLNPATFLPEKENETPDHDCTIIRDLIQVIPEWSSGFPYFLQFKSEFGNKEFMV